MAKLKPTRRLIRDSLKAGCPKPSVQSITDGLAKHGSRAGDQHDADAVMLAAGASVTAGPHAGEARVFVGLLIGKSMLFGPEIASFLKVYHGGSAVLAEAFIERFVIDASHTVAREDKVHVAILRNPSLTMFRSFPPGGRPWPTVEEVLKRVAPDEPAAVTTSDADEVAP